MEKIPDEVRKQIEEGVKEIAKKSTAPDKETPDWMETDIRRGAEFGYSLASKALTDANKEIERARKALDILLAYEPERDSKFSLTVMKKEAKKIAYNL